MKDIKSIIAGNIAALRTAHKMTQTELAEKLNYSDKAVSKWERAESIPDITVLAQISELFGVTVDYLIEEKHEKPVSPIKEISPRKKYNRAIITGISILLVWFLATFIFVTTDIATTDLFGHWLVFIYAVPASFIVWLVFNCIWFNKRRNFLIISLLMWSVLICAYLTALVFSFNIWLIFALGIPGQIIIFMWSRLRGKSTQ